MKNNAALTKTASDSRHKLPQSYFFIHILVGQSQHFFYYWLNTSFLFLEAGFLHLVMLFGCKNVPIHVNNSEPSHRVNYVPYYQNTCRVLSEHLCVGCQSPNFTCH